MSHHRHRRHKYRRDSSCCDRCRSLHLPMVRQMARMRDEAALVLWDDLSPAPDHESALAVCHLRTPPESCLPMRVVLRRFVESGSPGDPFLQG